jgi:glycosyltransferase involved in cell wall biosynthesis
MSNRMVERKQLLIISSFLGAGFSHTVAKDMASRLSASDWSVITTSPQTGRLARLLDILNTTWKQRNHYQVAIIDVYSGLAFIWAEMASALLRVIGKPYVLVLHGGNLPIFAKRWPGRVKRLLESANVVTTPSGYLLEQMQPYRSDLSLLANPLDLNSYDYWLRGKVSARLVWLRAFHEIYNPSMATEALALLADDFPDISLLMIGPDKGDGSLEMTRQTAIRLGIESRLEILAGVPKEEVPQSLNRGDIFINTTNIDNTPVSIMEAMASGLCIVSTNVGGIPYLLEDEKDCLLVPPNDPEAMAQAISRILTDSSLAQRLSENAREKARSFDWSRILPQWDSLLLSLTGVSVGN